MMSIIAPSFLALGVVRILGVSPNQVLADFFKATNGFYDAMTIINYGFQLS